MRVKWYDRRRRLTGNSSTLRIYTTQFWHSLPSFTPCTYAVLRILDRMPTYTLTLPKGLIMRGVLNIGCMFDSEQRAHGYRA